MLLALVIQPLTRAPFVTEQARGGNRVEGTGRRYIRLGADGGVPGGGSLETSAEGNKANR